MSLEYDPRKAAANLKKHGVSFADAAGIFSDPLTMTIEDTSVLVKRVS
ncbi:BrnT family toxin [Usitatibacter palustris]|nr:BrnT family toxin [Usitatibacter palustris]